MTQIATLLRKYQRDVWADRALEVQGVLGQQGVKEALLATSRWWGGMGSMNDNYLCSIDSATLFAAGIPSIESAEEHQDNRAFRSALLAVCDAIEANGLTMTNAESCAAILREWQRQCT